MYSGPETSRKRNKKNPAKTGSLITEIKEYAEYEYEEKSNVFWDSTSISKSHLFKVRIEANPINEYDHAINLQLFKKNELEWKKNQELVIEALVPFNLDPRFDDFNKDGFNDLTIISGEAARAANEIRTLFIFDPVHEEFIHVRNSEEYPNLMYNSETNSITGWRFYAGCATDFLELQGDSLVHIAYVEDEDGTWTSTVFNHDGTSEVIEVLKDRPVGFTRFSNYNPIKW